MCTNMQEFLSLRRFHKVKNGTVRCKHLERREGIPYYELQFIDKKPLRHYSIGLLEMISNVISLIMFVSLLVSISGCSRSNNLLLGRVEAKLGTHTVVVTDCYRTSVPSAELVKDSADGSFLYRVAPCADAEVVIRDERLTVNSIAYEKLSPGDTVIVDHGQVFVNTHLARKAPEIHEQYLFPFSKETHHERSNFNRH
jgi:hypothetical protein